MEHTIIGNDKSQKMMKNKTLAIFGIGTYVLSVLSSAEDLKGNYNAPTMLVAISGITTVIFIIMATIRLWKEAKMLAIIFVFSGILLFVLSVIQIILSSPNGGLIIMLRNLTKVISLIALIWVIIKLFKNVQ